jgi:hypothetical protein
LCNSARIVLMARAAVIVTGENYNTHGMH